MRKFHFILLVVGVLGQKNGPSYTDSYKNLDHIVGSRSRNGRVPYIVPSSDVMHAKKLLIGLSTNDYKDYREEFRKYYQVDDGNPDIHGKIERPCQVYDTFCIRKFFADHSRCKISGRAVPDPTFRAQLTVNYPHTNMSAIQLNAEYRGINEGRVEEFYINTVTDNLVITLFFPSINLFANDTVLKFYLRGREPILTRGFATANPLSFSVTVIIPHLKNLRLDQAEVNTFFNDPALLFAVGPGLAISTDPEVLAMLAAFLATAPLDQMEAGFTDANFYAATYIQYNICDFGLKVL